MRRIALALPLVLACAGPAVAQEDQGAASYMAGLCQSEDNTHVAYCGGYMAGVLESMVAAGLEGETGACDADTTPRMLIAMFLEYLDAHPEHAGEPTALVVRHIVGTAFPCKLAPPS